MKRKICQAQRAQRSTGDFGNIKHPHFVFDGKNKNKTTQDTKVHEDYLIGDAVSIEPTVQNFPREPLRPLWLTT